MKNWDWDELAKVLIPLLFAATFGILLAFLGGYLAVLMVFETFFGG